jgi:hypothetical protein
MVGMEPAENEVLSLCQGQEILAQIGDKFACLDIGGVTSKVLPVDEAKPAPLG